MASRHDPLIRVAKHLGYSDHAVSKILAAVDDEWPNGGGAVHAVADHRSMSELPTPLAAASSDPRKAAIIKQTAGMIKHATMARPHGAYELDLSKPVNVPELRATLREAKANTSTTMSIVENLFACGLVPA
jgi:hypothetical protein